MLIVWLSSFLLHRLLGWNHYAYTLQRTITMNGPSYYEFYRRSTIGATLADALDTLIVDQRIQPQLAMKVLSNFDRVTSDRLKSDVRSKMTFKGHLSTYRFCDDVWTFVIKDVNMKLDDGETMDVGKFKIVACNSKKSGE